MKAVVLLLLAAMSAQGANVLYFRDAPIGSDRMEKALAAAGHNVVVATGADDFRTQIESGAYDIGVFFVQKRAASEYEAAIQSLGAFVAAGGRALYADWSGNAALAAGFGAGFTGRGNLRRATLLDLDPAATPVPEPIALRHTGWFRSTLGLVALDGSSDAARFENGDAAIVRGATGRSLVFGFLSDTPESAAVFQRSVEFVLAPAHRPAITQLDAPNTPPLGPVTLSGTVLPNGAATDVVVEYGLTTAYGTQSDLQNIGAGIAPVAVRTGIAGLPPHTTYHYRFRASNSAGSISSSDRIFTTLNSAPVASHDRVIARGATTLHPLLNDRDADGDVLQIVGVTPASFGAVTFDANEVTYTPGAAGLRADHFTYTVADGFGGTATATVSIDMPLEQFRGRYSQLLGVAGRLQITLGGSGIFTGRLMFGERSAVLVGEFEADGIFRGTAAGLAITLELRLTGEVPHLIGTVDNGMEIWTSDAPALRNDSAQPPFGRKGRYTFAVPDSRQPGIPRGDAWAMFAGKADGRLRFAGRFADGAAFSGDGEMQQDGTVPLYLVRLDPPAESLAGALRFSDGRGTNLTGDFTWTRFGNANGFAVTSPIVGGRYIPPDAGEPIFKTAKAILFADIPGFPKKQFFDGSADGIEAASPNANRFVLEFSRATGYFGGAFDHRTLGRCKVSGVFVQPANAARGNFKGGGVSGSFLLAPRPK